MKNNRAAKDVGGLSNAAAVYAFLFTLWLSVGVYDVHEGQVLMAISGGREQEVRLKILNTRGKVTIVPNNLKC